MYYTICFWQKLVQPTIILLKGKEINNNISGRPSPLIIFRMEFDLFLLFFN